MNSLRSFLVSMASGFAMAISTFAHPVAQGALDLQVLPGKVCVQARVSSEEVFVANAFTDRSAPRANSLTEVWQRHGQYLLQHLKVFGDDQRLSGTVTSVITSQNDFVVYQLEFAVTAPPASLRIEEDVLNEIEYAPGNPWEAAYILRVQQPNRPGQSGLLLSRRQPFLLECDWKSPAAVPPPRSRMVQQFILHGIEHILSGYDHLLFVTALVLATATFWDLIKVVSAFTLAHTVTLTLSVLNVVRLPSHIVEPMIAGSIVFVAVTNVFWPKRSRGWMRLATAFFFGLFHGLGFAGGLLNATDGMTGVAVGLTIAAFSLGVEFGHQLVVLPLFFGLKFARDTRADDTRRELFSRAIIRGGSLLISAAGTFYLVAALR